eukprot:SAG31_NODE_6436_length_2020_cov_1.578345_1_plen_377_part_01
MAGQLVSVRACKFDAEGLPLPPSPTALAERQLYVTDTHGNAFVHRIAPSAPGRAATKDTATNELVQKLQLLSKAEVQAARVLRAQQVQACAAEIPCMGCRGIVEGLLQQLSSAAAGGATTGSTKLGLFTVTADRSVQIHESVFNDPAVLTDVLNQAGAEDNEIWTTGRHSGKAQQRGKRCPLHCLKPRAVGTWSEIWQSMDEDCQVFLLRSLSAIKFEDALHVYLRKHKFCSHCRSVVLDAFDMLLGSQGLPADYRDDDHEETAGLDPEIVHAERMFDKLKYIDGRVVIPSDREYIENLLDRAEQKSRGDKVSHHVKAGSMGQDEVLTCLGSYLWNELQQLWRQMLSNERSWNLLQIAIAKALKKTFDMKVSEKEGK